MKLNIKEVHGIGQYAAEAALTFRKRELELYRAGKLMDVASDSARSPHAAGGQRCDWERDSACDQFASEGQPHLFLKEENAEGILVLRGLVLGRRWSETIAKITTSMAQDRRLAWKWRSPDMVAELNAAIEITPPSPQLPPLSAGYAAAA